MHIDLECMQVERMETANGGQSRMPGSLRCDGGDSIEMNAVECTVHLQFCLTTGWGPLNLCIAPSNSEPPSAESAIAVMTERR